MTAHDLIANAAKTAHNTKDVSDVIKRVMPESAFYVIICKGHKEHEFVNGEPMVTGTYQTETHGRLQYFRSSNLLAGEIYTRVNGRTMIVIHNHTEMGNPHWPSHTIFVSVEVK